MKLNVREAEIPAHILILFIFVSLDGCNYNTITIIITIISNETLLQHIEGLRETPRQKKFQTLSQGLLQ